MNARFAFTRTALTGLLVVERQPISDHRGFLERIYCAAEFQAAGLHASIAQITHTLTKHAATVRGMHFQMPPYGEVKYVTCVRGEVFDVAVDLRQESETFLQWHAEILSPGNSRSLLIPQGFAHGFQTLCDDCEMLYLHTAPHMPEAEGAISPREARVNIHWPLEIREMSERDSRHPALSIDYRGMLL